MMNFLLCRKDSDSDEQAELTQNLKNKKHHSNPIEEESKERSKEKNNSRKNYKRQTKIQKTHIKKLKKLVNKLEHKAVRFKKWKSK